VAPGPPETLILASASPQRRALLEALGLQFTVRNPKVAERHDGAPRLVVEENALAKARAVAAASRKASMVIGGDTEVALGGSVLGKPTDPRVARDYLTRLSGREHEVLGGLAVIGPERAGSREERSGVAVSTVSFRALDEPLIDAYLGSGEWRGRAGGYAIQGLGSALIEAVRGDLSNVIGLPVPLLAELAPGLIAHSEPF